MSARYVSTLGSYIPTMVIGMTSALSTPPTHHPIRPLRHSRHIMNASMAALGATYLHSAMSAAS